ncbi:hypothetical protein AB0K09_11565 [Streptomyces sp. NPDC049577]|uniref:hypothetical protein n=1 Tax=Streptomyces sp. NPDC049577 TaxID=3155153 RepID=UPI003436CD4E
MKAARTRATPALTGCLTAGCLALGWLATGWLLAGCSDTPAGHRATATTTVLTTPSPAPQVKVCTDLITYWAEQELTGGTWAGLDWEQKGLSNAQYEIYDDVVHAARAEQQAHGTDAALRTIRQQTAQRCTAADGATHSSENWRPPD